MMVELLVVAGCAHEALAQAVLRDAAEQAGLANVQVAVTVIETDEQARVRGFIGSPTFLVDGVDPFAVAGAPTAVACRVYPAPNGLSGVPTVAALRDALVTAGAFPANAAGDQ
jgi:hypothetical protein